MTKQQVAEMMVKAKDVFQKWKDIEKEDFARMILTWYEYLSDMPNEIAQKAMADYVKENSYPPTIADIRKPYKYYQEQQNTMRLEYNNIYYMAISHYPCYQDSPEERMEFDRITGKSVSKATKLSNKLIEFVREKETERGCMPTLINWLKGIDSID